MIAERQVSTVEEKSFTGIDFLDGCDLLWDEVSMILIVDPDPTDKMTDIFNQREYEFKCKYSDIDDSLEEIKQYFEFVYPKCFGFLSTLSYKVYLPRV